MSEETTHWLAFANEDLRIAELALKEEIYNQVCFHAQQCVEKSIKASILAQGTIPRRSHAIVDLLHDLSVSWLADLADELQKLDLFYIPTRYPDTLPGMLPDGPPSFVEAESVLILARQVYDRALIQLSTPPNPDQTDDE